MANWMNWIMFAAATVVVPACGNYEDANNNGAEERATVAEAAGADASDERPTGGRDAATGGTTSTGGAEEPAPTTGGTDDQTGDCDDGDTAECYSCRTGVEGIQSCEDGSWQPCECDDDGDDGEGGAGSDDETGGNSGNDDDATGGTDDEPEETGGTDSDDDETGGNSGNDDDATGGTTSTGGTSSTGGTVATGGSDATGGTTSTGGTANTDCTPGSTVTCECSGNRQGIATCLSNGTLSLCACESGSGGTTSTGGTASTGGTVATGGTTSTGGTVSTGGTTPVVELVTYVVEFSTDPSHAWPNPYVTYLDPDDGSQYYPGNVCPGDSTHRTCSITVDKARATEFWMASGRTGGGSYVPGKQGDTGFCTAYASVTVRLGNQEVPFAMVANPENTGCRFRIEANAAARSGDDPDGDRVSAAGGDCAPYNPSIRPPLHSEDIEYADALATTCAGSVSGPATIRFEIPEQGTGSLLIIDPFISVGCGSAMVNDYENGSLVSGVFCEAAFDTAVERHFNVQVNGEWASYYEDTTDCLRSYAIYVYKDGAAYARFDGQSVGDFRYAMSALYEDATCHVVLPAW